MPDKVFIDGMRTVLLEKKQALQKNIRAELNVVRDSEGHHLADMDDLGSEAFDEATAFHILELGSANLEQIEYALKLIEKGEYGVCEECKSEISPDRLQAAPFATLCIECKRLEESG